jgi:hypothetical protein
MNDDAKAQGRHGQIVPLQAQYGAGDEISNQAGDHQTRAQGKPGVPAMAAGENRRGIGAQAKKGGMAQGNLAGVAHQQIEPDRQNCEQTGRGPHHDEVVVTGEDEGESGEHRRQQPPATQTLHDGFRPAPPRRGQRGRWGAGRAPGAG